MTNLLAKFQGASIINSELHVYGGNKRGHYVYNGHHKIPVASIINAVTIANE